MKLSFLAFLFFVIAGCRENGMQASQRRVQTQSPPTSVDAQAPEENSIPSNRPEHSSEKGSQASDGTKLPSNDDRPEQLYDPGKKGPYAVQTYSERLEDPGYSSAILYYPNDPQARIVGASTLSGGFSNVKENMSWLGEHLASHGVITLVFTPTSNNTINPTIWATGHKAAFAMLKTLAQRPGSPVQNKIMQDRIGIMGYSMGGAGTIQAINELGTQVRAAVPLCAFRPEVPTSSLATLLITGTADTVAVPANIEAAYNAMQTNSPKAYAKFNGMTHLDVTNNGSPVHRENLAFYSTAWYRVYLGQDARYKTFLSGPEHQKKQQMGIFALATDYRYKE